MSELQAGRELDALVAEKVMGLVPCENPCHKDGDMLPCFASPDSPWRGGEVPAYSTDIAAAWMVVEKMRADWKGRVRVTVQASGDAWECDIVALTGHGRLGKATADTAPLAICRAALAALDGRSPSMQEREK